MDVCMHIVYEYIIYALYIAHIHKCQITQSEIYPLHIILYIIIYKIIWNNCKNETLHFLIISTSIIYYSKIVALFIDIWLVLIFNIVDNVSGHIIVYTVSTLLLWHWNTWFSIGKVAWVSFGGVAFLEELCNCGWNLRFKKPSIIPSCLSVLPAWVPDANAQLFLLLYLLLAEKNTFHPRGIHVCLS